MNEKADMSSALAKSPNVPPPKGLDMKGLLDKLPELLEVADAAKAAEDKLNAKLNANWRLQVAIAKKIGLTDADIETAKRGSK